MIIQRLMKQYNKISDEELAAYLEGMLSCEDTARIDSAMDIDTLEVLGVAGKALDEFTSDNVVSLPSWNNISVASVHSIHPPQAMAGFLGDSNSDETFEEDSEDGDNR